MTVAVPLMALVNEHANKQAVGYGEGAGLGRGKEADADAEHNAQREQQRPQGVGALFGNLFAGGALVTRRQIAALDGDEVDRHHQASCDHKARQIRRREHLGN